MAGLECRSLHPDAHLLVINDALEQFAVAGMLASNNRKFTINQSINKCLFVSKVGPK